MSRNNGVAKSVRRLKMNKENKGNRSIHKLSANKLERSKHPFS